MSVIGGRLMKTMQQKIKMIQEELKNIQVPGLIVVDYSNPKSVNQVYDMIRVLKGHKETIGYMD